MKQTKIFGFAAGIALGFNAFAPVFAADQNVNNSMPHSPMAYYEAAYKDETSLTSIVEEAFHKNLKQYTLKETENGLCYLLDDAIIDIQGIDLDKEGYQIVKMAMKSRTAKVGENKPTNTLSSEKEIVSVKNAVIDVRDGQAPTIRVPEVVKTTENQTLDLNEHIEASDNSGQVELTVDESIDYAKPGEYTVNIEAKDASGNVTKSAMKVVVEKDDFYDRIAQAALSQVGRYQDCTMLVTNALKAVGIDFHGWPEEYAQLGSYTNNPVPGDIIIYSGHIALYIGDGQAVHGGWLGNQTVVTSVECDKPLIGYVHVAH